MLDEIGRGGMGVVYRARDADLDREVAVKILLDRYDPGSPTAERFVAEARITAQLQHPGIPAVYRVGALDDGRPFLAMKLIKGRTLDERLKAGDPVDALAVFEAIAQAVGYAHAHGVIHRDLKPSNVMVGAFGEVQVMDWGLAKVLSASDCETRPPVCDPESTRTEIRTGRDADTPFTQHGSVLGTPAFMAPEQAAGELDRIDARTDVFGLGAILCVLLTGRPPFDGKDAESIRLNAVRGKTEDALARLDASGGEPDAVSLCKRCLAMEPADRPADASAVAKEIAALRSAAEDRARQAELARARAEVQAEEQRKRRRVLQSAAIGITAVLLMGIAGTTLGLVRADRSRREAQASLAETTAVLDFVETKVFAAARPNRQDGGLGADVTLSRAIESAVPYLEEGFRGRPLIEARLRVTVGKSFRYLGQPESARVMFERARAVYTRELGPDHADTIESMNNLANAYGDLGRLDDALSIRETTFNLQLTRYGRTHPITLMSMNNLAMSFQGLARHAEALKLHEETLAIRKRVLPPGHQETLRSVFNLAEMYSNLGRYADALKLVEEALAESEGKFHSDHPTRLSMLTTLANIYADLGRRTEALKLREELVASFKRVYPPGHPEILGLMNNIAASYADMGRHADALRIQQEVLPSLKRISADHPNTLRSMSNIANYLRVLKRHDEAIGVLEETLAAQRRIYPPDHPEILTSIDSLASLRTALGQYQEALKLREEVLAAQKRILPPDHPHILLTMNNLALTYSGLGRHEESIALIRDTLARMEVVRGRNHPWTLYYTWSQVEILFAAGRSAEAVPVIDECIRRSAGVAVDSGLVPEVMRFRMRHFRKAADPAGCRDTAARWEALGRTDADSLYEAAQFRAIASSVFDGAMQPAEAAVEADRAMVWLKKAVAAGFKDRALLDGDKDLDPLRPREDFRTLVGAMPAKTPDPLSVGAK